MKTTKPISTISFNSKAYLKGVLDSLLKAKKISFYAFIEHMPEDDEGGKKIHYHVYVEPSKMLQTDDLREAFKEPDPSHPDKPLGCLKFVSSKWSDWYLYARHDEAYLASKGETRRYHYPDSDLVSGDLDDLNFMIKSINRLEVSRYADMLDAIRRGVSFPEYLSRGTIPIQQIKSYELAFDAMRRLELGRTNRNGHKGHMMYVTPDGVIDPDTGEKLEDLEF